MKNEKIKILTESAIMIALATVLSLVKIITMPLGGAVTLLSMLPLCTLSIKHGIKVGFAASFVYSILQLLLDLGAVMSWGLTPLVLIMCFLLDYILAFSSLGIAGIFRNKGRIGYCLGIALAMFLRFLSHFASGYFLFTTWEDGMSPFVYSIAYNGAYMAPELLFTAAATLIISATPAFKKILAK